MNAISDQLQPTDQPETAHRMFVKRIRVAHKVVERPKIVAITHPLVFVPPSPEWRGVPESALHE